MLCLANEVLLLPFKVAACHVKTKALGCVQPSCLSLARQAGRQAGKVSGKPSP